MYSNYYNALDRIRLSGGMNRLKSVFRELAVINRREAIRLLNDERLQFPALFILLPEIDAMNLYQDLNQRNQTALHLSRKKLKTAIQSSEFSREESEAEHQTLKWMLKTGAGWDGPSAGHDQYDAIIDFTAALLVVSYEDAEVLPDIAALLFRRNRKNFYIHDLVWAFFQSLNASVLRIVAKYLLSPNAKDIELACKLLSIKMPETTSRATMEKLYYRYLAWLDENRPFLYLTGEHFQMTSEPQYLNYDTEAKYLNREISPKYREPLSPLDENEISCLYRFRASPREEQELLSDYSYKLRRRDIRRWQEWIQMQTAEQVLAARSGYEAV